MSTVPSRSVPPPQVPAELVAEARIRILQEERAVTQDETKSALLCYELGAQLERVGQEPTRILEKYRAAYRMAPALMAPLLALHRIHTSHQDHTRRERVLDALHHAAPTAAGRAAFLTEHALLLLDQMGQTDRAEALLDAALETDPQCQQAALMLEHHHASQGQLQDAYAALEHRTRQVTDPALRGALLLELAEYYLTQGETKAAEAVWEEASTLSHGRYAALERQFHHAVLHRQAERALSTLQAQTALVSAYAKREHNGVEEDNAPLGRFMEPQAAAIECAVLYRELALLHMQGTTEPQGSAKLALEALQQALALHDDPLLWHEVALVAEQAGAPLEAARAAREMYSQAHSPEAQALWRFRQGYAAAAQNQFDLALSYFQEADARTPQRPAILQALQRQLWENGELANLCRHLEQQADRNQDDRDWLLLQAAHVALRRLGDERLGQSLCERIDPGQAELYLAGQRLLYAEATVRGWTNTAQQTLSWLLAHSPDPKECGYLLRARYAALGGGKAELARLRSYLQDALPLPACADWVPHATRVLGAQHKDWDLLAAAHARLADTRTTPSGRAAHLCATARAHIRGGHQGAAEQPLRQALAEQPENHYAFSLLHQLLAQRGDTDAANTLLHENALQQEDRQRALYHLMEAGLSAETQGDYSVAAQHYQEAMERESHQAAAAWALWFVGQHTRNETYLAQALTHLSQVDALPSAELELAELHDRAGRYDEADAWALRALRHKTPNQTAALRLWTFGVDSQARAAGVAHLRDVHRALPWAAREPDPAVTTSDDDAAAAPAAAAESAPTSTGPASPPTRTVSKVPSPQRPFQTAMGALGTLLVRSPTEANGARSAAFRALSQLCEAPNHHAALVLQSLRAQQLNHPGFNRDAGLVQALSLRVSAPEAIETAIALDELVGPGEDPKLRLLALSGRQRPYGTAAPLSMRLAVAQAQLASGHADEALTEARALLAAREDELAALELLREAAFQAKAPAEQAYAAERLARHCTDPHAAALLLEAACCHIDHLGNPEQAERCLRRCLALVPTQQDAFGRLHDLLAERGDVDALLDLLSSYLAARLPPAEQVDVLFESAQLRRSQGDLTAALHDLVTLLALDPKHTDALSLQADVYIATQQHQAAVHALDALARETDVPDTRRKARLQAAELLTGPLLKEPLEAIAQLRKLEIEGLANVEVLARLAELSQSAGLHGDAVNAYRRAAEQTEGAIRARYLRQSGTVLEISMGDAEGAQAAYRDALRANATDRDAHAALQHLLPTPEARREEAGRFMGQVLVRLTAQPMDPSLLRGLRSAAKYGGLPFAEYAALDALHALGQASPEERTTRRTLLGHRAHRPDEPLNEDAIKALRKDRDGGLGQELARGANMALAHMADLRPEAYGVTRRDRVKRGVPVDLIEEELWLFGLRLRSLYVGGENRWGIQLIPTGNSLTVDCVLGASVTTDGLSDRQRFAIGRSAMAIRQGTFALFELSPETRRHALFATAQVAELPIAPQAMPASVGELAEKIRRSLPRKARRRLEGLTTPLSQLWPGLEPYVRAAELTLLRAGLIQCGKLVIALQEAMSGRDRRIDQPPTTADDQDAPLTTTHGDSTRPSASLTLSDAGLDLLRFWTSNRSLALHGEARPRRSSTESPS